MKAAILEKPVEFYARMLEKSLRDDLTVDPEFGFDEFRPVFKWMVSEFERNDAPKVVPSAEVIELAAQYGVKHEDLISSVKKQLAFFQDRPLTYGAFMRLCNDWSLAMSGLAWKGQGIKQSFKRYQIAQKILEKELTTRGFLFYPLPLDLGMEDFFPLMRTEAYWIGVTSVQMQEVDGQSYTPVEFFSHDFYHATGIRKSLKEATPPEPTPGQTKSSYVKMAIDHLNSGRGAAMDRLDALIAEAAKADPTKKGIYKGVLELIFTSLHEPSVIVTGCIENGKRASWKAEDFGLLEACLRNDSMKDAWRENVKVALYRGVMTDADRKALDDALTWL